MFSGTHKMLYIRLNLLGKVTNKMSLEDATKNYFLQCIKNPDILKEIKKKIFDSDEPHQINSQGERIEDNSLCSYEQLELQNKEDITVLDRKFDLILEKQDLFEKRIEDLLVEKHNDLISMMVENEKNRFQEDINKLKIQNEELNRKYLETQRELDKVDREKINFCREIDNIKSEIFPLKKYIEMWKELEMLDAEKKEYVGQLCGKYNMDACLSLGRDEGKIEQLWRYLREEILKVDSDNKSISILSHYFEFCLDIANSLKDDADYYVFSEIEIGSEFDKELCIRTSDSKQVGTINKVLTQCVKVGDDVLYKAIVKVG